MIIVSLLHAHYSPERLLRVAAEMDHRGPPMIRAYYDLYSRTWFALEGTHRLRAAHMLGIAPILIPVPWPRSAKALERARFAPHHLFPRVIRADELCASFPACTRELDPRVWFRHQGTGKLYCGTCARRINEPIGMVVARCEARIR